VARTVAAGNTLGTVKIRIGFGLGTQGLADNNSFPTLVDNLESLGFDSLWLSERVSGGALDPVVGMSYAAGRTNRLKFGTSVMVLPGRNPVLLAKELASLDVLSRGRLLPAFGLGIADGAEQQAFGVERTERAAWFDEALPLIRRLWTEDVVAHEGPRFHLHGVSVRPKPHQSPPDVWLGGRARSELRRVGRLGDGWLPSFCTPADVASGRVVVEAAAAEAGRRIDPEHYGALIAYATAPIPDRVLAALMARRPDLDPAAVIPVGLDALRSTIERFVDEGFSKFVLVPLTEPTSWAEELGALAGAVLPLQLTTA
jgi:probable F420-dependent oxidoreductase